MNKDRYTNDRTAPRMKKAPFSKLLINKELWKEFRQKFPEYAHENDQTLNKYWNQLAEIMQEEIIKNPLGVKLGSYTGELKLQFLPYKKKAVDEKLSNEMGEKVHHMQIVTKQKLGKIKWERRWAVKFNRMLQFYAFQPTRALQQDAKNYIDECPEKLRVSRNTLGGKSFWRDLKEKK